MDNEFGVELGSAAAVLEHLMVVGHLQVVDWLLAPRVWPLVF